MLQIFKINVKLKKKKYLLFYIIQIQTYFAENCYNWGGGRGSFSQNDTNLDVQCLAHLGKQDHSVNKKKHVLFNYIYI